MIRTLILVLLLSTIRTQYDNKLFKRAQVIENEITALNKGRSLSAEEVMTFINLDIQRWLRHVGDNFAEMFKPIAQGVQEDNKDFIAQELEYFVNCPTCRIFVNTIRDSLKAGISRQFIQATVQSNCMEIWGPSFCHSFVTKFIDFFIDNLTEMIFHEDFICGYLIPLCQGEGEKNYEELLAIEYINDVLRDKPDFIKDDEFLDKLYEQIQQESQSMAPLTYKVLQITDWHVDLKYKKGTNKYCTEPICCQELNGIPQKTTHQAREYGEFDCDLPMAAAHKQLQWLQQNEEFDLILWTGDSTGHDVSEITEDEVSETLVQLTKLIKTYLPDKPLIPVLGNHDFPTHSQQQFRTPRDEHLIFVADLWKEYLTPEAKEQFEQYGYFVQYLPDEITKMYGQKVKVFAINTQACYNINLELYVEKNDAGFHLQWLREQFQIAEANNELVWVIGHIPPGDFTCIAKWSVRFNSLVERYQHLIRLNVFGHDHRELYEVARSMTSNKPIGVNYVAGSLGTYMKVNPSARIYTMHAKYHIPLDFKIYEFDLETANAGYPVFREYSDFRQTFGMKSLSPTEHSKLAERIYESEEDAVKFWRFQWKNGPVGDVDKCDEDCRRQQFCTLYFGYNEQKIKCLDTTMARDQAFFYFLQGLVEPWVKEVEKLLPDVVKK